MINRIVPLTLTTLLSAYSFSQTVGLSDQYSVSLYTSATNVVAKSQSYTPFTNPGGANPRLHNYYYSGGQNYNTAYGSAEYYDWVGFGQLTVDSGWYVMAGTAQDSNGQNHLQDIYGSTSDDSQGNQKNATFDDTFTVSRATTLLFKLATVDNFYSDTRGQGAANNYGNAGFIVSVNGVYKESALSGALSGIGVGYDSEYASISLNAGDTADISAFLSLSANVGTFNSQSPSSVETYTYLNAGFFVGSSNGADFATGSGMKYQSVPEPAAWLGLLLPVGYLIARRKKA